MPELKIGMSLRAKQGIYAAETMYRQCGAYAARRWAAKNGCLRQYVRARQLSVAVAAGF